MYTKTTMTVLCAIVLYAPSTALFGAEEDTTAQPARPVTTITLPPEVATLCDEMLKMINEGRRPNQDEVAAISAMLLQNKKNLSKYDEPGKMKYFMLTAWNSYFAGKNDEAVMAIQAGLKSGPEDPDMKATFAAIAIAAEKYPMVSRLAPRRTATRRRASEESEPEFAATAPTGALNFSIQDFKPQAVSRKLSVADAVFDCIGGATFAPAKTGLLCMLVYKAASPSRTTGAAQSSSEEDMSSVSPEGDPSSAFGQLMVEYADSGKVGFIGVSLDNAAATYNAMREVSEKRWFWPQVMAQQEKNKSLMELAKFPIDKPTMVLVTKDGTIAYMGSPAGFIPMMLLAKATDNYKPDLFVPIDPADPNVRRARMAADPNSRRRSADPNAVRGRGEDGFNAASNLQAETLYEHARSFLKGSRTTSLTAGAGVQACRQILERYSNTEYAPKARELLKDLPDEIKQRYNITPAEMGL